MFKHVPLILSLVFVGSFVSINAHAQATRTWVSGVGDDSNPCSRTAPCKTFAGAISKTAAGGEIDALDPAGYGSLTITKAITIDGTAALASSLVSGTNAFIINAGGNDTVIIRNMHLNGLIAGTLPGLTGIKIQSAGAVYIEKCEVEGFAAGITVGTSTPVNVYVSETSIANNANAIIVSPTAAANLVVSNSTLLLGTNGILFQGTSTNTGTIANSSIAGFTASGVAISSEAVSTQVNINGSTLGINGNGIDALAGTVRMSNVMTSQNANALVSGAGTIYSFGNNSLNAGNTNNGAASYVIPLQ